MSLLKIWAHHQDFKNLRHPEDIKHTLLNKLTYIVNDSNDVEVRTTDIRDLLIACSDKPMVLSYLNWMLNNYNRSQK